VVPQRCRYELGLPLVREATKPEKNYPAIRLPLPEDQLAEVFVCGDQEGVRLSRETQDDVIGDPWVRLSDVGDVVSVIAQAYYDKSIYPFVGKKLQAASWAIG